MSEVTVPQEQTGHINTVRALMIEQLRALRTSAPGTDLAEEIRRTKAMSELSQTIINSAKVEVEYLAVIQGDGDVPFLAVPDAGHPQLPAPADTKDPLQSGPPPGHPWRSTIHKLKG